jgi:hypothetical protein
MRTLITLALIFILLGAAYAEPKTYVVHHPFFHNFIAYVIDNGQGDGVIKFWIKGHIEEFPVTHIDATNHTLTVNIDCPYFQVEHSIVLYLSDSCLCSTSASEPYICGFHLLPILE